MRPAVCAHHAPAHRRCMRSEHRHILPRRRPNPHAKPPGSLRRVRTRGGVYVPSDSFGGRSPERKAAEILRTFFTFVAARVVLAQLEGSGRGSLGAYDSAAAADLTHFLQHVPLKDGDEWLAGLMRRNSSLGLRLMEVRDHYCSEAFEWDQLQRLAREEMKGANTRLMRQFATASLAASMRGDGGEGDDGDGGGGVPAATVGSRSPADWRSAADADASTASGGGTDASGGATAASEDGSPGAGSGHGGAPPGAEGSGGALTVAPATPVTAGREGAGGGGADGTSSLSPSAAAAAAAAMASPPPSTDESAPGEGGDGASPGQTEGPLRAQRASSGRFYF